MTNRPTAVLLILCLVVSGLASTSNLPGQTPRIAHAASGMKGGTRAEPAAARCARRNPAAGSIVVGGTTLPPYSDLVRFGLQSTVVEVDAWGHLFPEMATEVPTVRNGGIRDNGKTYVIHLKHAMRWSNGAEITSA